MNRPRRGLRQKASARHRIVRILLLAVALLAASPPDSEPAPWKAVLAGLRQQRDRMALNLERAHARLLEQAIARDDREAVKRLSPLPPRPRPSGYGVLPEVGKDGPLSSVQPTERTYSLQRLLGGLAADFRQAAVLADGGMAEEHFARSLDEFERLRGQLNHLEEQLAYHAKWQRSVVEYAEFFAARNGLVTEARRMAGLLATGESDEAARIGAELSEQLAPLRPTPGLRLVRGEAGGVTLPVTVHTDIADRDFLAIFREAVEAAFCESEAARSRGFALDLELRHVNPGDLYPEGVPPPGAAIDVEIHLQRFPAGTVVMTTGAESTHAFTGRGILLGPSPITRRTLAHEFAHLIGFDDAYLRGYDGRPDGAFGVVFVEWTGLSDDLMGNSDGGRVTSEMIDRLVYAYGSGPDP